MLGIRHVVLAINKMDLVGWSHDRFDAIDDAYRSFAASLGFAAITSIPLSALSGDNVVYRAPLAPWYGGPTLIQSLEAASSGDIATSLPFRMPVQWINRAAPDFRGYAGTIASGTVSQGETVRLANNRSTKVARIVTADGDLPAAVAGQSVTLTFADDIDVSRGDVIAAVAAPPSIADRIYVRVFWMGNTALRPGAAFQIDVGTAAAVAVVEVIDQRIDPNTAASEPADALLANDIGDIVLALDRPVAFDPYARNRETGAFILIDRETADTVGMGLITMMAPSTADEQT
jgi:sulfate adenylyltransferase subunit 1